jgi:CO dehydrogenase maturation factor
MKLAITGKGGVGKTTISSLLAWSFVSRGSDVIAVDANCDSNLAGALGIPGDEIEKITPIAEYKEIIDERTRNVPDNDSGFFIVNPKVDDIPDKYSTSIDRIKLLVMGTVKKGGSGCLCPESNFLRSLLSHLVLKRSDVVVVDMDAGLENLGRGTAKAVDAFIIVVEPGQRSFQTAKAIKRLAADIGIKKCYVIGSKTHSEEDRQLIKDNLPDFTVLGFINFDNDIVIADKIGKNVYKSSQQARTEIDLIIKNLEDIIQRG